MIRLCTARHSKPAFVATVMGGVSNHKVVQLKNYPSKNSALEQAYAFEWTWQYRADKKSLVDISDVLRGIFSDDV